MNIKTSNSPITSDEALLSIISNLPPLPKKLSYEDDYDEVIRSIDVDSSAHEFKIVISGTRQKINLSDFPKSIRILIHHFLLYQLLDLAPSTVYYYYAGLKRLEELFFKKVIFNHPLSLHSEWIKKKADYPADSLISLKVFLSYLCELEIGEWSLKFRRMISNLPVPKRDAYAVVRAGDCFLSVNEEAKIIRWIDKSVENIDSLSSEELICSSLVIASYQFGMRPKQMGILRKRDFEVRISPDDGKTSVYLNFSVIKQRNVLASRLSMYRKVKREWAPIFSKIYKNLENEPPSSFFFGFKSRACLSTALIGQLDEILPNRGCDAYALRHSMAQRLVDAGASKEELASALGHMNLNTGNVYFQTSNNQAELVNKALGASDIYVQVVNIAENRFISEKELENLKNEQQIAGIPHGIPISGIGGCESGQPSCQYHPVTSCYGCQKFMPVKDLNIHSQVLIEFRSIVEDFIDAGEGDLESPAYLQLRQTINEVQGVISQIEGKND